MATSVTELIEFYQTPLGRIARQLVRESLLKLDAPARDARILGLGYATPYLRPWLGKSERIMAFMPGRMGIAPWPPEGPNCSVLVDPQEMPLTDAAVDLVVAIHAFEHVADAEDLMRELWRITAPGATLVVVVPKRRGLWARSDNNPFGHGNPFSKSQLANLLRSHSFAPEQWRDALHLPPMNMRPVVRSARAFEAAGRLFGSALAGLLLVKAKRQSHPAIARRVRAGRLVRLPELSPQPVLPCHGG